jgi:hypothetical protein
VGSQAAWRLAAPGAEVVAYDRFAPSFKLSPSMGDNAADLALGGRTSQPIDFITTNGRTAA